MIKNADNLNLLFKFKVGNGQWEKRKSCMYTSWVRWTQHMLAFIITPGDL